MKNNLAIDRDIIRTFGRVNGRKLREQQLYYVDNLLPQLAVTIESEPSANVLGINYNPFPNPQQQAPLLLEIGFGYGEHVAGVAQKYPDVNFIACETFINGVATLVKQIDDSKIENIRILHGDARLLIDKLPDSCLDRVFILFPDPWPKTKQLKKRIINDEMLEKLARVIKTGGRLDVATDHVEYGTWIAGYLNETKLFAENKSLGLDSIPDDWVPTRYQMKAEAQGRGARFFNYVRI